MIADRSVTAGFASPVHDAQRCFRAIMNALARPGTPRPHAADITPPPPLGANTAAALLTLSDFDTPVWFDAATLAHPQAVEWLCFHTGAPVTEEPAEATFALITDPQAMPPLERYAVGTAEYPDRSTTLILQVAAFDAGQDVDLSGPGIAQSTRFATTPVTDDFWHQASANNALFPLGVDVVFAAPDGFAGLPRSTAIHVRES